MKKELFVMENKTMCLFPWTHMYVHTSGDVYPCCIAETTRKEMSLGNVKQNSIEEIWNNEKYRELRKNMVEGTPVSQCNQCYTRELTERRNYRHASFDMFRHHAPSLIENTNDDYSLKEVDIKYFDVRFSNLCSFKCRYCSEEFSTSWAAENRKYGEQSGLPTLRHVSNEVPTFLENLKSHLHGVEHMYFAGGEPLMTEEHYEVLETLINENKTDVKLRYSSNCSTITHKHYNVIDLWQKFKSVDFRASLDSVGTRAEYMRKGTKWDEVVANILEIKKNVPHVNVGINCVVSVYNILTLSEFLHSLNASGVLDWEKTSVILYPISSYNFLDVNALPVDLKKKAKEKLDVLLQTMPPYSCVGPDINIIRNYINYDEVDPTVWKDFKMFNESLDEIRNEKFVTIFPELAEWYQSI